ncbi:MAG: hypothetical protein IPK97_20465 [Ahniella sp.]|nr:hypothetical protein [Ahniella sp.]
MISFILRCVAIFASSMIISSCYSHSEERKVYGRFELVNRTTTDQLRFEGGNTRTNGGSLCSLEHPDFCIHSETSIGVGYSGMPDPQFLIVHVKDKTWYLDAVKGVPIDMGECSEFVPPAQGGWTINGDWTSDQRVSVNAFMRQSGVVDIVEFNFADSESPTCKVVHSYGWSSGGCRYCDTFSVVGMKFGESDDVIAWLYCNPSCSLDIYDRVTRKFASADLGCDIDADLGVRWRGKSPEVVHLPSALHENLKDACVDESGKARFRFEKYGIGHQAILNG